MKQTIILIFVSFLLSANCAIALKNTVHENFAITANDLNGIDFSTPTTIANDIYKTLVLFVGENDYNFDQIILENHVNTILERKAEIGKSPNVFDFSSDSSKLNFLNQVSFFYGVSFELVKLKLQ